MEVGIRRSAGSWTASVIPGRVRTCPSSSFSVLVRVQKVALAFMCRVMRILLLRSKAQIAADTHTVQPIGEHIHWLWPHIDSAPRAANDMKHASTAPPQTAPLCARARQAAVRTLRNTVQFKRSYRENPKRKRTCREQHTYSLTDAAPTETRLDFGRNLGAERRVPWEQPTSSNSRNNLRNRTH